MEKIKLREIELKPLDIIAVKGRWYHLEELIIMWRSITHYSHCFIIKKSNGDCYDATVGGIKNHNLFWDYKGREITICRLRQSITEDDIKKLLKWVQDKQKICKGYDYIAWIGFATALWVFQDEKRWFCSELPYWMFQDNGYTLTNLDLWFPYPSFFVYCTLFELVWEGLVD